MQPPKSLLLKVRAATPDSELVADHLWQLGATAVELRDEPNSTVLIASFPVDRATREAADVLRDKYDVALVTVNDSDWRGAWKEHAQPVEVGHSLRVVPAWRADPGAATRYDLHIDPGQCFGSGTHATTRTLLALLEDLVRAGMHVLDVGTGSGILAVAAASLGAARVDAIDIDPAAVPVTTANAKANGVSDRIHPSTTAVAAVDGRFDLVLANLSAATLAELARDLIRLTAPTGLLLVSGMLAGQWRHVAPLFETAMRIDREITEDGWTTLVLTPRRALD